MSSRTFDELYVLELGKQGENGFNVAVCVIGGVIGIPLAIFAHPAWIIVSILGGLFYWFHRSMYGGERNLAAPAVRQACEFMVRVREKGHDRSLLPFVSIDAIMQLALMEKCEHQADGQGAKIAQNLHCACARCQLMIDSPTMREWWTAKAAFKQFSGRRNYVRDDGMCVRCGNAEAWFESSR